MNTQFKIILVDSDFCKIVYQTESKSNEQVYYCLQWGGNKIGVKFYRCTQDYEPEYEVKLKKLARELLEIPTGDSFIEKLCADWIRSKCHEN
jgi:hypothetical protein